MRGLAALAAALGVLQGCAVPMSADAPGHALRSALQAQRLPVPARDAAYPQAQELRSAWAAHAHSAPEAASAAPPAPRTAP